MELARSLVHVRLVDGDERSRLERARRRQGCGDLRRVVPVVVDHAHAAAFADELEPPADSRESDDDAFGLLALDSRELEGGERRGGVHAVVVARHRERQVDRLELPAAHDRGRAARASARRTIDSSASEPYVA